MGLQSVIEFVLRKIWRNEPRRRLPEPDPEARSEPTSPKHGTEPSSLAVSIPNTATTAVPINDESAGLPSTSVSTPHAPIVTSQSQQTVPTEPQTTEESHLSVSRIVKPNGVTTSITKAPELPARLERPARHDQIPYRNKVHLSMNSPSPSVGTTLPLEKTTRHDQIPYHNKVHLGMNSPSPSVGTTLPVERTAGPGQTPYQDSGINTSSLLASAATAALTVGLISVTSKYFASKQPCETSRPTLTHQHSRVPVSPVDRKLESHYRADLHVSVGCEESLLTLYDAPGRDKGCVATSCIQRGTILLQERPAFSVPKTYTWEKGDLWIRDMLNRMAPEENGQFQKLQIGPRFVHHGPYIGRFRTNELPYHDTSNGGVQSMGLFLKGSCFNHSCVPNVHQHWDGTYMQFRAMTDIQAGQELHIGYNAIDLLLPVLERRAALAINRGYECRCYACLNPSAKSDERRLRVKNALHIANHKDPRVSTENVHRVIAALWDLYAEGLYHYRETLFFDGFLVCNAVGDSENARLWLEKAYLASITVVGDNPPQIKELKAMLDSPVPPMSPFGMKLGPPPELDRFERWH